MWERFNFYLKNQDLGLFLIRLAVGVPFLFHGLRKLFDVSGVYNFFQAEGLPGFLAVLVLLVEITGSVVVIMGTKGFKLATASLALVMIGAILLVKFEMGFIGGYELDYILLLVSLGLLFVGPGRYVLAKKF